MREAQILEAIQCDNMFGMAEVDIIVPDELRQRFSEMITIFKNVLIARDDGMNALVTEPALK